MNSVGIIGIGNPDRCDDAAGLMTAALVRQELRSDRVKIMTACEPIMIVDLVAGFDALIVIDACASPRSPGELFYWSWPTQRLAEVKKGAHSHDLTLLQALELANATGDLPQTVRVVLISGKSFAPGHVVTPAVRTGAILAAGHIVSEVGAWLG